MEGGWPKEIDVTENEQVRDNDMCSFKRYEDMMFDILDAKIYKED